jgi:hypothetical protein
VACEESQRVCIAFRNKGHEAYSCDIQECSGDHPEWHIKGDVIPLLNAMSKTFCTMDGKIHTVNGPWDMIIAFPPCTDLAVSGARYFEQKRKDGRQQKSIDFFLKFTKADCEKIAIENPVGIMSTHYRKPDQIIHPYFFGHPVSKKTCLWLKGLPLLHPTNIVNYEKIHSKGKSGGFSGNSWFVRDENGKILKWCDPETAKIRSKTYIGVAEAMADQWG